MKNKILLIFVGILGYSQLYAAPSLKQLIFNNTYADKTHLAVGQSTGNFIIYPTIEFSRSFMPGTSTLENVEMEVELVLTPRNWGGYLVGEKITKTRTITNADYSGPWTSTIALEGINNKSFAVVDAAKLLNNGVIVVRYRYKVNNVWSEYFVSGDVAIGGKLIPSARPNPFWRNGIQTITGYTLSPNTPVWRPGNTPVLVAGQSTYTANGAYFITLQTDGSLVLYRSSNNQVLWSADSGNKGGRFLFFQGDGNLVLYKNENLTEPVWDSGFSKNNENNMYLRFVFQDDGNLIFQFDAGPFVEIIGETQTYNRVSSHFGKL